MIKKLIVFTFCCVTILRSELGHGTYPALYYFFKSNNVSQASSVALTKEILFLFEEITSSLNGEKKEQFWLTYDVRIPLLFNYGKIIDFFADLLFELQELLISLKYFGNELILDDELSKKIYRLNSLLIIYVGYLYENTKVIMSSQLHEDTNQAVNCLHSEFKWSEILPKILLGGVVGYFFFSYWLERNQNYLDSKHDADLVEMDVEFVAMHEQLNGIEESLGGDIKLSNGCSISHTEAINNIDMTIGDLSRRLRVMESQLKANSEKLY